MRVSAFKRPLKVHYGPAYRPINHTRPRRVRTVSLPMRLDTAWLLEHSLTEPVRRQLALASRDEREVLTANLLRALSLTALGKSRTIHLEDDGALSCVLPLSWRVRVNEPKVSA